MNNSNRLIYAWYYQYENNFVSQQGISFTREYLVDVKETNEENKLKVWVDIKRNKAYHCPDDFYGENIGGLTAVIGENGSGKTTIARMLMDYPIPTFHELSPFFWIVISDENKITIYCYKIEVCVNDEQICKKDWCKNPISAIYLTNIFNFFELNERLGLSELEGNSMSRQIYSPAYLLLHASEIARKERYGYRSSDNRYLVIIQQYANLMEQSDIQAYIKKQEELMIECYVAASDEIKDELGIFDEYEISIAEFAKGIEENKSEVRDEKKQKILAAKGCYQELYHRILENHQDDFWLNIYVLCLAEAYLALLDVQEEKLKNKIKEAGELDLDMISVLKETANLMQGVPWASQLNSCIDMLEQYAILKNKRWRLGKQKFNGTEEMIFWYYEELKKPYSFFKRNLSFKLRPNSSGEQAMINLFSYIVDAINREMQQREFLIIIDEIDAGLHPRWQQNIIRLLLEWLKSFEKYHFQIVVTSHSPIVLSDVLKEHVIKLKKKANDHLLIEEMKNSTFGANIAMQFLDAFYMDKGNIGSFSQDKIRTLIEHIGENQDYDSEKWKELYFLVDSIGEDIVRKKLLNDIYRKESGYDLLTKQWENSNDEKRRQIIRYIEHLNVDEEE